MIEPACGGCQRPLTGELCPVNCNNTELGDLADDLLRPINDFTNLIKVDLQRQIDQIETNEDLVKQSIELHKKISVIEKFVQIQHAIKRQLSILGYRV